MAEIEKDIIFYDESGGGVTFSGGEPLFQWDFLLALLQACKEQGIHTAVDTTGLAPYSVLAAVSQYTDLFLYDLKLMDKVKHMEYTGVPNQGILDNLIRLAECHQGITVRVPLIPGITDTPGNLEAMAAFLKPIPILEVELLPYHNTAETKYQRLGRVYPLAAQASPSPEKMAEAAAYFATSGHKLIIGGVPNE
jgi:pyruvate formate lyase activating enzyme